MQIPDSALACPSTVEGFPTLRLDVAAMTNYLRAAIEAHVAYGLGSKCPEAELGKLPIRFRAIDCSGFARALIAAGTDGKLIIPDGSVNQHSWCLASGFKPTAYAETDLRDGHVRIAFHAPNAEDSVGHVWLDYNGGTLESWGGHGPGSRPVTTAILERLVTAVYVLA